MTGCVCLIAMIIPDDLVFVFRFLMGTMFRAKCHIHAEINAYRYRKTGDWKAIWGGFETSVYTPCMCKELYVMINHMILYSWSLIRCH